MTRFAPLAVLAVFVMSGCAQVDQGVTAAADAKRQANDIQARLWTLEACDLSLGGLHREVPPELRKAALDYCLQDGSPSE